MTVEELAREIAILETKGTDNTKIQEMLQLLNRKVDKK